MAYSNGPIIVTSGLVLSLDAADLNSYTSGSSTWFDLSGNSNSGSLSGPTYSGTNLGNLVFNGSSAYVGLGTGYTGLDLVSKSFQGWIKKTGSSNKGIIDKDFDNGVVDYGGYGFWIQSNNKLWWWNQGNQDILDTGPNTVPNGVWTNVAVAYNSSTKNASFYINGVLNSSITNASIVEKASGSAPLVIGSMRGGNVGWFFDGSIASMMAYNRLLSATEILQNYNALKSRFGL